MKDEDGEDANTAMIKYIDGPAVGKATGVPAKGKAGMCAQQGQQCRKQKNRKGQRSTAASVTPHSLTTTTQPQPHASTQPQRTRKATADMDVYGVHGGLQIWALIRGLGR